VSRSFLVPLCALLLAAPVAAQDFSDVSFTTTHVAGSVHVLSSGVGGNIGVSVGEDGILLIDDQFAPLAERIEAAIAELGEGDYRFVLNTHFHGDHTGANAHFQTLAPVIAHENVRKRLMVDREFGGRTIPAAEPAAWPVLTFADGVNLHLNGEDVRVVHVPRAHTDGDAIVIFPEANVIHMGDVLFYPLFPFVDIDGGGSVAGMLEATDRMIAEADADTKVVPGHGEITDIEGLRTSRRMIAECLTWAEERVAAGDDLEAMKTAGVPAEWKDWTWGFINEERWIETLHRSVTE
jgi:glyoxylase-like metal-dependent hydrolase (beta-lactamase superfamily II)